MRDRRAKFVELANKRMNRAIRDIRLVANLSNRAAYEFGDDDAKKISKALQREVDALKQRFSGTADTAEQAFKL